VQQPCSVAESCLNPAGVLVCLPRRTPLWLGRARGSPPWATTACSTPSEPPALSHGTLAARMAAGTA
jgi:hypothetical protein